MLKVRRISVPFSMHVLTHGIKFMAWERSFEKKVLKIRDNELKYQRLQYIIEVL